jgi:hypothetical protein
MPTPLGYPLMPGQSPNELNLAPNIKRPHDPNDGIILRYGVVLGFIALIISQILGVPNQYALIIFTSIIVAVVVIGTAFLILVYYIAASRPLDALHEMLSRHMPSNDGANTVSTITRLIEGRRDTEGRRDQSRTVGFSISVTCDNCGNTKIVHEVE